MKAMVLAAGLGTRLRPLTDHRPKALVEVGGRTLLEITLARLRSFGIHEVIINVHHFADMVQEYLKENHNFGMRLEISREDALLDTGGGLKKAACFLLEKSGDSAEPFILHNVDVVSTIDLGRMVQLHREKQALATLAVQERETSRYLLFDEGLQLCGRRSGREGKVELVRPAAQVQALAFSGIHVISPRLLTMLSEAGAFSIITSYLRIATRGLATQDPAAHDRADEEERIVGFRADEYYWRDLGRPDSVLRAAEEMKQRGIAQ